MMAKRIEMTRARQIALPVLLEAARDYLQVLSDEGRTASDRRQQGELERALEAFK